MKNPFWIILLAILIASCSTAQPLESNPVITAKPIIITPVRLSANSNLTTPTQEPTVSAQPTEAATPTPTILFTPTSEPSFYTVAACLPRYNPYQTGTVTEIIDGDTIIVRLDDGNIYSVRYIGIDAPERDMPFFPDSYNVNAELVHQKEIFLVRDVSETDQYDRLLRYVVVGDVFVNQALVEAGAARAMQYPPDIACAEAFSLAEQQARASQLGLWASTATRAGTAGLVVIVEVNKRDEYVDIQNTSDSDVDLSGWNLVSERGHQECYLSGILKAGEVLRVWAGNAQQGGFGCGYSKPIWNNSEEDPAVLYDAQGIEVSRK